MSWRPHPKHAAVNPSSPRAWGTSDRNGFIGNLEDLRWQYDWAGTQMINKRILVHKDELDEPQEQLRAIKIPPDPDPVLNARPEPYSVDEFQNTPLYAESGKVLRNETTNAPLLDDNSTGPIDDGKETIP